MFKKIILTTIVIIIVGAVLFFALAGNAKKENGLTTIEAKRGQIIDKALAVGVIEPKQEISVKSKIPGIVRKIYVDIGDQVKVGYPLMDIAPDPTPIEFAEAKRNVEIYQTSFDNARRQFERARTLLDKDMISNQEFDSKQTEFEQARLRLELAKEKLDLLESGQTQIADMKVDNTIKSPISGMVLSRLVEEGDPVVPLTTYQAGTELMTLAYMEDLIFKGTVDEIDVGKLRPGMPAEIKVGALPKDTVGAMLDKISPKAYKDQGSTVFDVELVLTDVGEYLLRAGYSANADIIIKKKDSILIIPERLIEFRDDSAFVEVQDSAEIITQVPVEVGLSDGINIEITSGLTEGDKIVQRPPREID